MAIPPAAKKSRDFVLEHPEIAIDAINRMILVICFMVLVFFSFFNGVVPLPLAFEGLETEKQMAG